MSTYEKFRLAPSCKGGDFNRHIVLKIADIEKYLTEEEQIKLEVLRDKISEGRDNEGKNPVPFHFVINTDESFAPEIVETLKRNGHWG